jgi:hypothetical protein
MRLNTRNIISIVISLLLYTGHIFSQEATTPPDDRTLPRSYTQQDLDVIVGNVQRPNGIVHFDGNLYIVCNGDWTVYRVNAQSGATITFVFGVQNAHALYAEATETGFDLWIPDFDTNRVLRVDETQTAPEEIAVENLDGPWGIAPIAGSGFLISNVRSNTITLLDNEGKTSLLFEGLRSPTGLVIADAFGYVVNNGSARRAIEWFDVTDEIINHEGAPLDASEIMQPLVTGLQNVSNLVLADDGYLYFTYALGTRGVVGRIDPDQCRENGCTNEQVEIVLFTELPAPLAGLTITPDFQLFVHTIYRPELYTLSLYDGS